jgi:hypothetical protein
MSTTMKRYNSRFRVRPTIRSHVAIEKNHGRSVCQGFFTNEAASIPGVKVVATTAHGLPHETTTRGKQPDAPIADGLRHDDGKRTRFPYWAQGTCFLFKQTPVRAFRALLQQTRSVCAQCSC